MRGNVWALASNIQIQKNMKETPLPGINQFNMKGRTAMITGGSKGLGLAMAAGLASADCSIALVNRNLDEGTISAAKLTEDFGINAKAYSANVTNLKQVEAVVKEIENDFGKIDILINSAGINIRGAIDELSPEDFDQVMKVNVEGTWNTSRAVTPMMKN